MKAVILIRFILISSNEKQLPLPHQFNIWDGKLRRHLQRWPEIKQADRAPSLTCDLPERGLL